MKSSEVVWLLLLTRPIGWKLSSLRSPSWPPLVTPSRTSAARTCSQHASRAHYTITGGYYHLDVLPVRRQSAQATNELAICSSSWRGEVENTPIFLAAHPPHDALVLDVVAYIAQRLPAARGQWARRNVRKSRRAIAQRGTRTVRARRRPCAGPPPTGPQEDTEQNPAIV